MAGLWIEHVWAFAAAWHKPGEAESLKRQYFATFGKVHEYLESLVSTAREKGYTETIYGRRRYFPGLKSSNRAVRDAAERAALNAPIQGSACGHYEDCHDSG